MKIPLPPRRAMFVTMTPMIDVIFLLLIFFVCTASFQRIEETIPAALTSGASNTSATPEEKPLEEPVWIHLRFDESGKCLWSVNNLPCATRDEVKTQLAPRAKSLIIIDPEAEIPFAEVLACYDLCRELHCEQVQFAINADE